MGHYGSLSSPPGLCLTHLQLISRERKTYIFLWKETMEIQSNYESGLIDKFALLDQVPDKKSKMPYTDHFSRISTKKWKRLCDENNHNRLYQIQPILKERKPDPNKTRKKEITLTDYAGAMLYTRILSYQNRNLQRNSLWNAYWRNVKTSPMLVEK